MKYARNGATRHTIAATPLQITQPSFIKWARGLINQPVFASDKCISFGNVHLNGLQLCIECQRTKCRAWHTKNPLNLGQGNRVYWQTVSDYCGNIEQEKLDLFDTRKNANYYASSIAKYVMEWVSIDKSGTHIRRTLYWLSIKCSKLYMLCKRRMLMEKVINVGTMWVATIF